MRFGHRLAFLAQVIQVQRERGAQVAFHFVARAARRNTTGQIRGIGGIARSRFFDHDEIFFMASVLRTGESKEALYVPNSSAALQRKVKGRMLTDVEPCEGDSRIVREPVVASQRANEPTTSTSLR